MGGVFKKAFGPIKISLLYEHCAFLQPFFCGVFFEKIKKKLENAADILFDLNINKRISQSNHSEKYVFRQRFAIPV